MPFDPTKPANNAAVVAAELRAHFTALNADTQQRATATDLATTSGNSNGVEFLSLGVSDPPSQGEVQTIADNLDELINALRR
jgi:hypothetical protein